MDKKEDGSKRIWKEVIDPTSRSVYYWNVLTGETSWVNPVPDDSDPLPFDERVSHDSKVIIDKLVHKVDRLKFFFDEISLINDVCDHLKEEDINSLKEYLDTTLTNLDKILDTATPKTRTYKKFLDLKKFLVEQKSYLKNNGYLSDQLLNKIKEVGDEVKSTLENLMRFEVNNEEIVDGYKIYVEKRKQNSRSEISDDSKVYLHTSQTKVTEDSKLEFEKYKQESTMTVTNENKGAKTKKDKKSMLKSIHDRWIRASEIIDEDEVDEFEHETKKQKNLCFINTEKDNPNLVPISKPWYENQD